MLRAVAASMPIKLDMDSATTLRMTENSDLKMKWIISVSLGEEGGELGRKGDILYCCDDKVELAMGDGGRTSVQRIEKH